MKNFNWKDLLRHHPLFGNLNEQELERFLADEVSEERAQPPGSMIVREGEFGNSIFLIGSGSVEIVLRRGGGHEITLALLLQGELFGEMALFQNRRRTATVITKEPCSLLEVRGEEFLKLMSERPEVELKVLLTLTERLRNMNEQVLAVLLQDVDEKFTLFNTKLDAELKVFDASLKAAQAVFEQTKVRTDEVITSAERRQASQDRTMRFFGVVVSVVMAAAGWFGVSKFSDLTEKLKETEKIEEEVKRDADAARHSAEQARKQEENLALIPQITANLEQALLSMFSQALADEKPAKGKIVALYKILLPLRANDPALTWRLLGEIERGMVKTQDTDMGIYQDLLAISIREAQVPRERIVAYYLFLSSLILNGGTEKQKGQFDKSFAEFQAYVREHKNQRLRNELDFSLLKAAFDGQGDQRKRDLFQRVKDVIP
ncbi:MAG TPA: cyclic nucleotide-binding domain-containing protein [Candidatus Binatia bacterium]|nr:cyclic nucleotide-binding domain-containing protein [Candidatus Binatia bacterium]